MPVGIDDDEEGVAPGEGVIVAQQADVWDILRVAGVEVVGGGLGEERVAQVLCDGGDAGGGTVEVGLRGLFVIAVDEEDRVRKEVEEMALAEVDGADGLFVESVKGIDAEVVAEEEVEVGAVGGGGAEDLGVQGGVEHLRALGVESPCSSKVKVLPGIRWV